MIRIGPAGWSYKDWAGIVYPEPLPKGFSQVEFLSKLFDTIEINTSFYGPPSAHMSRRWPEQVKANPRFRFTAKLWRGYTHERKATAEDEKLVKDGMAPLAEADRLGKMEWVERGGPLVSSPEKTGFGTALIAHSLAGVGGKTLLEFDPEGLRCHIQLPVASQNKEEPEGNFQL